MSKQKKPETKDNNISSKLLGANLSDINIQKFRDISQYNKDKYQLQGKFSIPLLKSITNKFSPMIIFAIVLPNQAISNIDAIQQCQNLIVLNFRRNCIQNISALNKLKKLRIVDLADNSITNIDCFQNCQELVNLHLQGNLLKSIQNFKPLKDLPFLKNVHLQTLSGQSQNPICGLNNYRQNMYQLMSKLHRLDGIPRNAELNNGSQLKMEKQKELKIDIKNIGPFYTTKFPSNAQFTMPSFDGQTNLKKNLGSCKSAIQQLELKMRAVLTSL